MTLLKAIEILTCISYGDTLTVKYDIDSAIKLSKEALKGIVYLRKVRDTPHWMTLPGETEE